MLRMRKHARRTAAKILTALGQSMLRHSAAAKKFRPCTASAYGSSRAGAAAPRGYRPLSPRWKMRRDRDRPRSGTPFAAKRRKPTILLIPFGNKIPSSTLAAASRLAGWRRASPRRNAPLAYNPYTDQSGAASIRRAACSSLGAGLRILERRALKCARFSA